MKLIIDVHEHIFNANDIPLEGYLKSRKYKGLSWLLSKLFIKPLARCVRRKLRKEGKFLHKILCPILIKTVGKAEGKGYVNWAKILSMENKDIANLMTQKFKKDNIDLYIPLMIDYEYWLKNTEDIPIKEQRDNIYRNVILPHKGTIHPFISFDPARELAYRKQMKNPDGKLEEDGSLNLVKESIDQYGFIGVKLYNAMGYRPVNNALVDEKRRKIALHKKKYVFKGEEYDEVLKELYEYCVKEEIPITTHCEMDGSEAYHDASFDFGHPIFWKDILDNDRFSKLKLNLAHFGWNKDTFHEGNRSWVQDICKMLEKYENLYTDVSHNRVVLKGNKEKFIDAYTVLSKNFPWIKKKILFGIDWHVIERVLGFEDFKDRYIEILDKSGFNQKEIDDFLGINAVKFLGLNKTGKNRKRLQNFYNQNSIGNPAWLIKLKRMGL